MFNGLMMGGAAAAAAAATGSTSLLMNFDTALKDDSSRAHPVTVHGDATRGTTDTKFGTGALHKTRAGAGYLSVPNHTSFVIGAGVPFTIRAWVKISATFGANLNHTMFALYGLAGQRSYDLLWRSTGNFLRLLYSTDGTNGVTIERGSISLSSAEWRYVTLSVNAAGAVFFGYNGSVTGPTGTNTAIVGTLHPSTDRIAVGARSDGTNVFDGIMDGVDFVKGQALHTADFTPPTTPPTEI